MEKKGGRKEGMEERSSEWKGDERRTKGKKRKKNTILTRTTTFIQLLKFFRVEADIGTIVHQGSADLVSTFT